MHRQGFADPRKHPKSPPKPASTTVQTTLTPRLVYRALRDTGYSGIMESILFILLPGIWDTEFSIMPTFRDPGYLGKLIMGI